MFRKFQATNQQGTCIWCGRKLRKPQYREGLGDYGDGFFCGLRCGYDFAVDMARCGKRMMPVAEGPKPPQRRKRLPIPKCPTCGGRMKVTAIAAYSNAEIFVCQQDDCATAEARTEFGRDGRPLQR